MMQKLELTVYFHAWCVRKARKKTTSTWLGIECTQTKMCEFPLERPSADSVVVTRSNSKATAQIGLIKPQEPSHGRVFREKWHLIIRLFVRWRVYETCS